MEMKILLLYIFLYFAFVLVFKRLRSVGFFEWNPLIKAKHYRMGLRSREDQSIDEPRGTKFFNRRETQVLRLKSKPIAPLTINPENSFIYRDTIAEQERRDYDSNIKEGHLPIILKMSLKSEFVIRKNIANGKYAYIMLVERKSDKSKFVAKIPKVVSRLRHEMYGKLGIYQDYPILKDLRVHPNIVRLVGVDINRSIDAGIKQGVLFDLIFEHLEFDLDHFIAKLIETGYKCHSFDLRHVIRSLFSALRHLKRNQIIHRGIRPKSIYISESGVVKLGDFGHAQSLKKKSESEAEKQSTVAFHDHYKPPEVWNGEEYSYPADVWCIGMVMLTMILQKNPLKDVENIFEYMHSNLRFDDSTAHSTVTNSLMIRVRTIIQDDEDVVSLLMLCLAWDPMKRITPEDAKSHRFFTNIEGYEPSEDDESDQDTL